MRPAQGCIQVSGIGAQVSLEASLALLKREHLNGLTRHAAWNPTLPGRANTRQIRSYHIHRPQLPGVTTPKSDGDCIDC